jgi:hypothetical protein
MLLIAAWPDNLVAPELIVWGMTHKFRRIQWYSKRFTECAYNSAVERLALPSECQHFMFADRDMRPGPDTEPFLQAEGELVACQFDLAANESWEDPQAMHCGLWRCSRRVLEAIKPPWFVRVLSDTGVRQERCPCLYFRDKAHAAGFTVVRAGWCRHEVKHPGRRLPTGAVDDPVADMDDDEVV